MSDQSTINFRFYGTLDHFDDDATSMYVGVTSEYAAIYVIDGSLLRNSADDNVQRGVDGFYRVSLSTWNKLADENPDDTTTIPLPKYFFKGLRSYDKNGRRMEIRSSSGERNSWSIGETKTIPDHKNLSCCHSGFHASRHVYDALGYVEGAVIALVSSNGSEFDWQTDKFAFRSMTIHYAALVWDVARSILSQHREELASILNDDEVEDVIREVNEKDSDALKTLIHSAYDYGRGISIETLDKWVEETILYDSRLQIENTPQVEHSVLIEAINAMENNFQAVTNYVGLIETYVARLQSEYKILAARRDALVSMANNSPLAPVIDWQQSLTSLATDYGIDTDNFCESDVDIVEDEDNDSDNDE